MSDLEKLLLQAAGRTSNPSNRSTTRPSHYSSDSSDSDPQPNKKNSHIPLKKRQKEYSSDEEGGSEREDSFGSDLYKDEDDKEQLEKMSELDREMILAERSTRRDDYRLKKMAMARASGSAATPTKGGGEKKSKRESPPSHTPMTRASGRGTEKSNAARSALDELKARRMRQQDPEGYRNRLKSLAGDSSANRDRSPPPPSSRRRAGSPPSDGANDSDSDRRPAPEDLLEEDLSPRLESLKFEDIKEITIRRSRLVKWFMDPFFEDLIPGCFVRVGIGKLRSGQAKYRLCTVKNVDATEPDKTYQLEHYTTCKYLNLVWDDDGNAARWKMTLVSDAAPLEHEFQDWLKAAQNNDMRIPTRQEVLEKKEAIQKALNFVYSAATVKQMLQEKKSASLRPANVAAEKDRLRKELEKARQRRDDGEAGRILTRLRQLEQLASKGKQVDSKAAKLAEMNRKNRQENFKNASEVKQMNLKEGEAGYDPFSRRWTRSRNYYASKPEGGTANENSKVDGANIEDKDSLSAAQQVAAGAGKLTDTNAPIDGGTESHQLHDFEIDISLAGLQRLGGGPDGVFLGLLMRKQRVEAEMGAKVEDDGDGRRHALTLTVGDYKRRRGLL
ncbi:hypothetical protein LUZ60_003015 [Juncus effusus]|nr:hypothetical protein LUZ60_003015 [Juncus effusus]